MSIKIADRVKETSLTQGTGTLTLNGAFGGFQSFSSAIGNGNSTYYAIENESRWEVGIGTYTSSSNTLSRDTVLKSSSGTSKIDISGVAIVFCSYPADKAVIRGEDGLITESGLLTLIRDSAGNFFHAYKDDSYDRTISLYTDGNASPEWKLGVKNSPSSETEAPSEGYVYGKDGQVGLVGNSSNSITLDNTTNFTVKHNSVSLIEASASTGINLNAKGIHLNTNSASYPAITINGAALQSQPLTEWKDSAGNVLSIVDKDGNMGVNRSSASYELDVTGSGRFTSVIFADATEQSTAYTNQEVAVSGWAKAYVDSQDHSGGGGGGGSAADILANSASGVVISGIANTNSINIASNLVEIRANSASGVVISGIANANVTNIATNASDIIVVSGIAEAGGGGSAADILVVSGIANTNAVAIDASGTYWLDEIRANSASGVVISGIANTNVSNIASNLVEIRANSASGVVISGIANTNVSNIASNLVEIRANSASGVVISGIANTAYGWGNHGAQGYSNSDTTYTAGSGLELHGTAFQAAISGANLLATNTPTDNYVPSYDAATGKLTWVANAGGGGGISNVVEDSTPQLGGTLDANSNVIDMGSNNITDTKVGQWDAAAVAIDASGTYWLDEIRANSASGVVISGIANANVTNIASNLVEIRANSASGVVISGIANTNSVAINASGTYWLDEIRANSASGVVISGIANTNVTNIASNLVEIRANSASGVVISGIANTNVTNIAGNLVEIRANSASGVVISGIANTNAVAINASGTYWLDEIRANSASGVVISGIANTNSTNIATNTADIIVVSGIAEAGGGGDIEGVTAGFGLSGGGTTGTVSLAVDISEFSDVTPANGDKLLTLDSDGSTEQLTTVGSLATLLAGAGLTATNSVIAVDTLNQNTTGSAGTLSPGRTINDVAFDGSANITVTAAGSTLSDTVTVAKGGVGQTSYTNGQLLIGNTTGNTLAKATLTAGSNVTITNGTGSITIAATDTNTTYAKSDFDLDHLFTLVGAAANTSENLGTFTGSTISDSQTIKASIQALETAVETKGVTAGSSSILTVGALDAGSITSGFGNIDNGGSSIACGSLDVSDGNITNVGDIDCDSISIDDAAVGLNIAFGGNTTLNKITLTDNLADALNVTEGSNSYIKICTTNAAGSTADAEKIHFGQATVGATHTDGSAQDASLSIDCSKGNYHEILLGNHDVTSVAFTNASAGQRIVVRFKNHSTAKDLGASAGWNSVTINGSSATLHWPGGTEPTLTDSNSAIDVYGFVFTSTVTTAYGFIIGQDIKA